MSLHYVGKREPWKLCLFSEALLQVVGVADECLVHALFHPTSDLVVDRV